MKRILAFCLSALLAFFAFPVVSLADEPLLLETFETGNADWQGITISQDAAHSGEYGGSISNLTGGYTTYGYTHLVESPTEVFLEANRVYSLQFWVKSTVPAVSGIHTNQVSSFSAERIAFDIYSISDVWKPVSISFVSAESRACRLSLLFYTEDIAAPIYIDDLTLTSPDITPMSCHILGRSNVTIPEIGTADYRYRFELLDEYDRSIPSVSCEWNAYGLPDGVSFDPMTGILSVSEYTMPDSTAVLEATFPNSPMPPAEMELRFTQNLVVNGDFEDRPETSGWDTDFQPHMDVVATDLNHSLILYPTEQDESAWVSSVRQDNTLTLNENELYVLRAKVKSPGSVSEEPAYAVTDQDAYAFSVQIHNISGDEWQEVYCAFRAPLTSCYELTISLHCPDGTPIYMDDVTVSKESVSPSELYLSAPGYIAIPEETACFPYSVTVLDQESIPIDAASYAVSISPEHTGVWVDESGIWVSPDAVSGEFNLTASFGDTLTKSRTIRLGNDMIGDGSFETTKPDEWWGAIEPATMYFSSGDNQAFPTEGDCLAKCILNDEVALIATNSYAFFRAEQPYVLQLDAKKGYQDIDTVLTAMLEDAFGSEDADWFLINSFDITPDWERHTGIFVPEQDMTARLLLFASLLTDQTDQSLFLDHLTVSPLTVSARNAMISGGAYPDGTVSVYYDFENNFDSEDASIVTWYYATNPDGPFLPIGQPDQREFTITSDMVGGYLKAEIAPMSMLAGFIGETVSTEVIQIAANESDNPIPEDAPAPSLAPGATSRPMLKPVPVSSANIGGVRLHDLSGHWAEDAVMTMAGIGIATGFEDGSFRPDLPITRAEFAALVTRCFGLTPKKYSGKFADVAESDWYSGIVETCVSYGLANGISDSMFAPNAFITREEMAVMAIRAYNMAGGEPPISVALSFLDQHMVSSWAKADVEKAYLLGIVRGTEDNVFSPKTNSTRAQAVVILLRMLSLLED